MIRSTAKAIALPRTTPHEEVMQEFFLVIDQIISASTQQKYKLFLCATAIYAVWFAHPY